jgi:short-subunit dehydrogenase
MDSSKQTALVTGASSGFGVEIARVLAERGWNLALSARRKDRLETLAEELRHEFKIDVTVVPGDLGTVEGPQKLYDDVQAAGLQIDALINNAGFGHFGPFLDQTLAQIDQMIAVDVSALTTLTWLFATQMKQRGSGYILQVSSFAALQPIPRYSVYSGAKAYVVALVQSLQHELRKTNVKISAVVPGFMSTEFHNVADHERTFMMKVTTLPIHYTARKAVNGMLRGKLLITPGLLYQINGLLVRVMPRRLASRISALSVGGSKMNP